MQRNRALDVLRFVAVLLVLVHHMTPFPPPPYPFGVGRVLLGLAEGGWCGVDLFFVLSGFLVSGLLFREYQRLGDVSFARFFVRRGLKIYPAFYVMLVVYGVVEQHMTHKVTVASALGEAFFVQNYAPHIFNHTWSLAVEEHFYLLIGVCTALLAARKALRWVPLLCALTFPLCLAMRFYYYVPGIEEVGFYASHTRIDALAFGVLLSYVAHFHPDVFSLVGRRRGLLAVASVLALLPVFSLGQLGASFYLQTVGLSVNYLAFGALVAIAGLPAAARRPGWIERSLALLGSYSYSVYLWHMFVKRALSYVRRAGWIDWPYPVELGLFIALSFAFGVAMAKLVEIPVLKLRDRYWPSRDAARASAAPVASTATSPP
jgi:peptidoglycan/LPS O-acetylase OafA/YrhL